MTISNSVLGAFAVTALLAAPAMAQVPSTTTTTTTITTDQTGKVRTYVTKEKRASVKLSEDARVGGMLPNEVQFYEFPEDVGVRNYRYSIINGRTVLVDPTTRRVVQIID